MLNHNSSPIIKLERSDMGFLGNIIWFNSTPPCHVDKEGLIYNADMKAILPNIPDKCIDMIFTDPPYGINYKGFKKNHVIINDSLMNALSHYQYLVIESKRILKPGGCFCSFCPSGGGRRPIYHLWTQILCSYLEFKQIVVWDKDSLGIGGQYRNQLEFILIAKKRGGKFIWNGGNSKANIYRQEKIYKTPIDHPTPKPLELLNEIIKNHTKRGQVILDPFSGHGSTLISAKQLGRRYIGIEIEGKYCEIATYKLN